MLPLVQIELTRWLCYSLENQVFCSDATQRPFRRFNGHDERTSTESTRASRKFNPHGTRSPHRVLFRSRQRPDLDGSMPPPSHELAASVQKLCGVGRLQPRKIRQSLAQQDQLIAFAQRSRFPANRVEHHCFTAIEPDEKARLQIRAIGQSARLFEASLESDPCCPQPSLWWV